MREYKREEIKRDGKIERERKKEKKKERRYNPFSNKGSPKGKFQICQVQIKVHAGHTQTKHTHIRAKT